MGVCHFFSFSSPRANFYRGRKFAKKKETTAKTKRQHVVVKD
jgi:hypothetical protein